MSAILNRVLIVAGIASCLPAVAVCAAERSPAAASMTSTDFPTSTRVISVEGQGEIEAVPDIAEISTGVTARADTARQALDASNAAMGRLMATLRAAAIGDSDIRTSDFAVSPVYERADAETRRKIVAYDATNQVTVTIRNLNRIGTILDSLVTAGSNRVQGIRFRIDKPDALLDEARSKAFADARRRAEIYAGAASGTLGQVLRVTERVSRLPEPRMFAADTMLRSRAVPVAPGTQQLTVNVSVQFALE